MNDNSVYELRRYRLQPAKRETLIELFEREFIEPQEQAGMTLHGLYKDKNDPNAFVWMRSFSGMTCRSAALAAFYGGSVWERWGGDANATMLNSDNVLLLKETAPGTAFDNPSKGSGLVTVSTCSLAPDRSEEFFIAWKEKVLPVLQDCGARIDASFITDQRPNPFRRLPVREGENVFVWIAAFQDERHHARYQENLSRSQSWTEEAFPWLDGQLWRPLETAILIPTEKSRHGW